jgi:hypothetical protein
MFFLQVINKHTPQNGANPTLRSRFSMWTDYPKVFGEDQGESMYNRSQCLRHATASRQLHARFVPKDPYSSRQDVGINIMSAESLCDCRAWREVHGELLSNYIREQSEKQRKGWRPRKLFRSIRDVQEVTYVAECRKRKIMCNAQENAKLFDQLKRLFLVGRSGLLIR